MRKTFPFFIVLLLSYQAFACFNTISVVKIPGVIYETAESNAWELKKPYVNRTTVAGFIAEKEMVCGTDPGCNDLVIAYFYAGEMQKALELSTRLVRKYPAKYEIVMTHAAALELNGRFKDALKFIRKGMRIDPHSHKDSEWIHVKILESLIAGGTPESILDLDFGNGNEPDTPKGIAHVRQMVNQIHYQLRERYHFIPENDPQFGALLHDYANLLYLSNFKTVSRAYYDLAIAYGYDRTILPNPSSLPALPKPQIEPEPELQVKIKIENERLSVFARTEVMMLFFVSVIVFIVAGYVYVAFKAAKKH